MFCCGRIAGFVLVFLIGLFRAEWIEIPQISPPEHETQKPPTKFRPITAFANTEYLSSLFPEKPATVDYEEPVERTLEKPFSYNIEQQEDRQRLIAASSSTNNSVTLVDQTLTSRNGYPTMNNSRSDAVAQVKDDDEEDLVDIETVEESADDDYDTADYDSPSWKQSNENVLKLQTLKLVQHKPFGFGNFLNFLKNMQQSFVLRTARGIKEKINLLKEFKNKLLHTIEKKISVIWPSKRIKRTSTSRGFMTKEHMEFPSHEGALMTISFLTFAVFLVKLVLQVINTLKSKHYSYNGFDSGTPVGALNVFKTNRNARQLIDSWNDYYDMDKVMDAINKKPQ